MTKQKETSDLEKEIVHLQYQISCILSKLYEFENEINQLKKRTDK